MGGGVTPIGEIVAGLELSLAPALAFQREIDGLPPEEKKRRIVAAACEDILSREHATLLIQANMLETA